MIIEKLKDYFIKYSSNKPDYRIVYVENDTSYGTYYKIERKDVFGYRTYYFHIPDDIFFDRQEFRFKTFDAAKEELDLLMQGKSKYNYFRQVVYETPVDKNNVMEQGA